MSSPSTDLALWLASWLRGDSSADEVIDAMAVHAPLSLVVAGDVVTADRTALPWPTPEAGAVVALLSVVRDRWRRDEPHSTLRVVLPAPGDVRGVGGSRGFSLAAIAAGQGVVIGCSGGEGIGLVPTQEGPDVQRWTVFALENLPNVAPESLRETEYVVRESVRGAAAALTRLATVDAGESRADPRTLIAERLAHGHPLPPLPERVTRVLDTADHITAILDVAQSFSAGQPLTAAGTADRDALLAPLRSAVRSARTSAVDATVAHWFEPR